MKKLPCTCHVCEHKFGWHEQHLPEQCMAMRLDRALKEVAALKSSVASWKDAWFRQREATGMYGSKLYDRDKELRKLKELITNAENHQHEVW